MKASDEKSSTRIRIRNPVYGYKDPDPEPAFNPAHCPTIGLPLSLQPLPAISAHTTSILPPTTRTSHYSSLPILASRPSGPSSSWHQLGVPLSLSSHRHYITTVAQRSAFSTFFRLYNTLYTVQSTSFYYCLLIIVISIKRQSHARDKYSF